MDEYLIVDGYNIINNWSELDKLKQESLDHARQKLIEILSNYQALAGKKVILVFDAYQVKNKTEKRETITGVEVIYSKENETADMVIERIVSSLPNSKLIYVATSDWDQQRIVLGKGAVRLSARELMVRVIQTQRSSKKYHRPPIESKRSLESQIGAGIRDKLEEWRRNK